MLDEGGTQVSSSNGSAKPPSLDGKSVASGTTFALDEKESLRPDDSASVKATEDEDAFLPSSTDLPGSRTGSDEDVRAFRDQLREISSMNPARQVAPPQTFGRGDIPAQGVLYVPPQGSGVGVVPGSVHHAMSPDQPLQSPPDIKLLEALESPKDRIMVLKLEQDIVDFVKDAKESSMKLPQTNAFYRMLAHRLADYYMLGHIVDESTMAVQIYKTPSCRLPPPLTGIATPSTAASTPPPGAQQMKILRRGMDAAGRPSTNGSKNPSKTTSENGDSGNDDERKSKAPATREEREARYEAARKRIMGTAKPAESPEQLVEKGNSRSSSAAGKRGNRRRQRADRDDDFEARSAYYPTPMAPNGHQAAAYGFQPVVDSHAQHFQHLPYNSQDATGVYQQYGSPPGHAWPNKGFNPQQGTSQWVQNQTSGYDMTGEFQRVVSFQQPSMTMPSSNNQSTFNPAYGQQYGASMQQNWPQQSAHVQGYPQQNTPSYPQSPLNRPPSSSHTFHANQPYAFGQLPSQTFPGRPANNLEHPIPGSYKGKHFNPQSQAFVPGQANGTNGRPHVSQGQPSNYPSYGPAFGVSPPLQWQNPMPAQHHPAVTNAPSARPPNQQMTHPLPQPVFPRQPSPNMPLPAKPETTSPKTTDMNYNGPPIVSSTPSNSNHNSIAKWGTPASLPAKPPPSAETYDSSKLAQPQRPTSGSNRVVNTMPSFGSMPPMAGFGMNGQAIQSSRRA